MPKKSPEKAGPIRFRAWTTEEMILLRERFSSTSNFDLAKTLSRTEKSVVYKAAELGLRKSDAHRSAQSKKTVLASGFSSEHMADIGQKGGLAGGPARAKALSSGKRRKIAVKAIRARWNRAKSGRARKLS